MTRTRPSRSRRWASIRAARDRRQLVLARRSIDRALLELQWLSVSDPEAFARLVAAAIGRTNGPEGR